MSWFVVQRIQSTYGQPSSGEVASPTLVDAHTRKPPKLLGIRVRKLNEQEMDSTLPRELESGVEVDTLASSAVEADRAVPKWPEQQTWH